MASTQDADSSVATAGSAPNPSGGAVASTGRFAAARWPRWGGPALLAVLTLVTLVAASIGARDAAHDARVLSFLDPLVQAERTWGWQTILWLLTKSRNVAWAVTGIAAAVALAGTVAGARRGVPLILLAAAISLATWGQVLLLDSLPLLGAALLSAGVLCAMALGAWRPLDSFGGLLPWPAAVGAQREPEVATGIVRAWPWRVEWLLVLLLSAVALATRLYALTELPQGFDPELIEFQILSRTWYGFSQYVSGGAFLTNGAGVVTQLTQMVLFQLFGTSLYTLRLAAVCWGVAAVPLFYWFVRRLAGTGAAAVATILFVAAPEQLFWSRTENTHFAAIAVLALICAHLGLWMLQRLSALAVLATALWMPACRYFYTPGMVMFFYPLALYGHALVFVRGAWRKAWYVIPLLAGGVALWIFSLSVLYSGINHWQWRFVHPAWVHGAPAWRKHGDESFLEASIPELIRLQSSTMATNLAQVIAGITYNGPSMFSHFFLRHCASANHMTATNAGLTVMLALGLGYMIGQPRDRRAFLLVSWVAIGLLPGIMSNDPSARRLSLAFPAFHVIAGIMLAAIVRLVRACAGAWLAVITGAALAPAVMTVVWTSLASHYLVGTGPAFYGSPMRFAKPLFQHSDMIMHNLPPGEGRTVLFGNLDELLAGNVCYHYVGEDEWLAAVLDPQCAFNEYGYTLTMPPDRIAEVKAAYRPQRVSYLLEDSSYNRAHVDLLSRLHPGAELRHEGNLPFQRNLVSMTVNVADVQALHQPELRVSARATGTAGLETSLLEGVRMTRAAVADATLESDADLIVGGGLLVPRDGWYGIGSDCPDAKLTIDGRAASTTAPQPLLSGAHPFELRLTNPSTCRLPLRLLMQSADASAAVPVLPTQFVSPAVASSPAHAEPVATYSGFGDARVFAILAGGPGDLGVDAQGFVSVLLMERGVVRVQRFDPAGHEVGRWLPEAPPGRLFHSMAVAPDGTTILMTDLIAVLYNSNGSRIGTWQVPWGAVSTDVAVAPDGRIVLAFPTRQSIGVFRRDGHLDGEISQFDGGPGRFFQPSSLALGPDGAMAVIQDDGQVLVFRSSGDLLKPAFVSTFRVDFSAVPFSGRGCVFDGPDRLLIPDPTKSPFAYHVQGERLMAAVPARDLSVIGIGATVQLQFAGDRLYALDGFRNRIWTLAR